MIPDEFRRDCLKARARYSPGAPRSRATIDLDDLPHLGPPSAKPDDRTAYPEDAKSR